MCIKISTCRESTKKKVRITYNVLEYFCVQDRYAASPDTFDKFVFGRFIQYLLTKQKMADSTIHRHVKALKAFFKFTYPQKDILFMKYSMLPTDEEIVALREAELEQLLDADLSGLLDKTRDLFSSVITSHTARRTFFTFYLQKEMPIQNVAKMSGHSDFRSMNPYI